MPYRKGIDFHKNKEIHRQDDLNPNAHQFYSQYATIRPMYMPSGPPVVFVAPPPPPPTYPSNPYPSPLTSPTATVPMESLSLEQIREKLRKQLEYYFSKDNLINDLYLQSQMDQENYVLISTIANFKLVKRLTNDLQLITSVFKEIPSVEVDSSEQKVRSTDPSTHANHRKRCIIILRNVPIDATEEEISQLFDQCSPETGHPVEYERVLGSNETDCWYVTFNDEDQAQHAFLYLTRENLSIRGQKILARMKARLWQKGSQPSNASSQPIMPPVASTPYPPPVNYNPYVPYDQTPYPVMQVVIGNQPFTPTNYYYMPTNSAETTASAIFPVQSLYRNYAGGQRSKNRYQREHGTTLKTTSSKAPKTENIVQDQSLTTKNEPDSSSLPTQSSVVSDPMVSSASATTSESSAPSYADMLKLKQNPSQSSNVASLPMEKLTVTDNPKNNHAEDEHLHKRANGGNHYDD